MQNFEFNSFNIVSLNVRGLRDSTKRKALFLFCKHTEADRIFLQETDSGETNCKFCKSQWGNSVFFDHGTNHSAGVVILLHKVRGDIIDSVTSSEGRWLILVVNVDNACFLLCNICGYNSHISNRIFFSDLVSKIFELQEKYTNVQMILSGDFNETPDSLIDRFLPRVSWGSKTNGIISSL